MFLSWIWYFSQSARSASLIIAVSYCNRYSVLCEGLKYFPHGVLVQLCISHKIHDGHRFEPSLQIKKSVNYLLSWWWRTDAEKDYFEVVQHGKKTKRLCISQSQARMDPANQIACSLTPPFEESVYFYYKHRAFSSQWTIWEKENIVLKRRVRSSGKGSLLWKHTPHFVFIRVFPCCVGTRWLAL